MEDFYYCVMSIKKYIDKIQCRKYNLPINVCEIVPVLKRTLKEDYGLEPHQCKLTNPNIIKIIYDCVTCMCMLSHEIKDHIAMNDVLTYESRFIFPDYIFPSERKVIEEILFSIVMEKLNNSFNNLNVKYNDICELEHMFKTML
jgi:hypothetical protein